MCWGSLERSRSIRQRPEIPRNGTGARKSRFGSVLRARGRLQDGPGNVQGASWRLPGHPKDNFGCSSDASVAPCIVQTPLGSDFRRFCFVVHNLRCASRTTFYCVLLLLDEESSERVGRAPNLEIAWFSASKIDPETVRGTQNRDRAVLFERYTAKAMRKIYKSRRRGQSNGQSSDKSAAAKRPKNAQAPKTPRARYVQIDRDVCMNDVYLKPHSRG